MIQFLTFAPKLERMKLLVGVFILALHSPQFSSAQNILKPRTIPLAMVTAHFKSAYLKITYSQPQKNHREIFGKLVPFDQVWQTGANEATEITTTNDILIKRRFPESRYLLAFYNTG